MRVHPDDEHERIAPLQVVVRFGSGISGDVQARSLLEFERILRKNSGGDWIEVFKEIMGDDSKLASTDDSRSKE